MDVCPTCGARLETPLGCSACGVLFSHTTAFTPFAILRLEPRFALESGDLKRRLLRASRVVHPDFFAGADAEVRARAEHASALVNEAFATLSDPAARADWLVRSLDGPSEAEQRDMPRAFLMEVLEWNEVLERARAPRAGAAAREELEQLKRTLRAEKTTVLASLEKLLTPLPPPRSPALVTARSQLNALRYLDNTLAQIDALSVELGRPN